VMGDAVVAPVVSWLEMHILRPLATGLVERAEGDRYASTRNHTLCLI